MSKKRFNIKSRKGILLTLVTIVLFLLMLSEIITYVTFNINYDSQAGINSATFSSAAFASSVTSGGSAFLRNSMYNALGALVKYEGTPSLRNGNFINNTALAVKSLMTNGTIYGYNGLNTTMGGATLKSYINYTKNAGFAQNVNVTIKNGSITVFQGGPFSLNATLTGLVVINSTYGVSAYPLSVTAGIPLNGTVSLYSAETADTSPIKAQAQYPMAQFVGNTFAIKGSTSSFMFAYGTIVYESGMPTCATVPSAEQNKNFILATPNANDIPQNACGMAGIISYSVNSAGPQTPYLMYPTTSSMLSLIQNGTSLLLDGKGLALYNLSQLQNAALNGYSYSSTYVPAFLDQAQANPSARSPNGAFSLSSLNRGSASFNSLADSYIVQNSGFVTMDSATQPFTISIWIDPSSPNGVIVDELGSATPNTNWHDSWIELVNGVVYMRVWGMSCVVVGNIPTNGWSDITVVGSVSGSTLTYSGYINGVFRASESGTRSVPSGGTTAMFYPLGVTDTTNCGSGAYFSGDMANYQFYANALSSQQVYSLYLDGIGGAPAGQSGMLIWLPLNGNANDYSGNGDNANAISTAWSSINNYKGNPLLNGAFVNGSSNNQVEGALNCGTINQCSNSSLEHMYLGAIALAGNTSVQVGQFNGQTTYAVISPQSTLLPSVFTLSAWVNLRSYISNAGACCAGGSSTTGRQEAVTVGTVSGGEGSYIMDAATAGGGPGQIDGFACLTGSGSWTQVVSSTGVLSTNKWYLETETYDGSNIRLWVDGQLEGTAAATGSLCAASTANTVYFGTRANDGSYFNGSLADVQVYNSPLSQAQILRLYAEGINGAPVSPGNVMGWWPLNGTLNDFSGNGNNGGNVGGLAYVTTYTNQTNGTSTEPQALRLGDAVVPNVATFNGVSASHIQGISDKSWPAGSQAISIFAWVRSTQSAIPPFIVQYGNYGNVGQNWILGDYDGQVAVDTWGGYPGSEGGASIADGKWHFVGFTYAGGGGTSVTIYTDGTATSSSVTTVPNVDTASGTSGNIGYGTSPDYNGSIADVQIYNVSLTQAQVNQLMTNDSVIGVSPVAWFPLGTGVGGLLNETPNLAFPNNFGYLGSCNSNSVINGECGVKIAPP